MATLPAPAALIDWRPDMTVAFVPVKWELGTDRIFPPHAPTGKDVRVLRVHVREQDVEHFPRYHDFTAESVIAQLQPMLDDAIGRRKMVTITARGIPPKRRFTVEVAAAVPA